MKRDSGTDASDGTRILDGDVIRYRTKSGPYSVGVVKYSETVQVWRVHDTESSVYVTLRRLVFDSAIIEIVTDDKRSARAADEHVVANPNSDYGTGFFARKQ